VKYAWSCTLNIDFMEWGLIKHRDNFIFTSISDLIKVMIFPSYIDLDLELCSPYKTRRYLD
jgi:hypothetical protein